MKRIRIGNDITLRITITRQGAAETLTGKNLTLLLRSMYARIELPFTQQDNVLTAQWFGTQQEKTGTYTVTLVEDYGQASRNTVDSIDQFCLVARSTNDNGALTGDQIIDLDLDITTPANGLSAYELALAHGYTGTEEEWLKSLSVDGKSEEAITKAETAIKTANYAATFKGYQYICGKTIPLSSKNTKNVYVFRAAHVGFKCNPNVNYVIHFPVSTTGVSYIKRWKYVSHDKNGCLRNVTIKDNAKLLISSAAEKFVVFLNNNYNDGKQPLIGYRITKCEKEEDGAVHVYLNVMNIGENIPTLSISRFISNGRVMVRPRPLSDYLNNIQGNDPIPLLRVKKRYIRSRSVFNADGKVEGANRHTIMNYQQMGIDKFKSYIMRRYDKLNYKREDKGEEPLPVFALVSIGGRRMNFKYSREGRPVKSNTHFKWVNYLVRYYDGIFTCTEKV